MEQFPTASYDEYQYLKKSLPGVEAISYTLNVPQETMKYEDKSVENVNIGAVSDDYYNIEGFKNTGRPILQRARVQQRGRR